MTRLKVSARLSEKKFPDGSTETGHCQARLASVDRYVLTLSITFTIIEKVLLSGLILTVHEREGDCLLFFHLASLGLVSAQ